MQYEYKYLDGSRKPSLILIEKKPPKLKPLNNDYTYILKLEDDCWYVGISKDVDKRFKQHCLMCGARWTMQHKPIAIHRVFEGNREQEITLRMMDKYGRDKVRGFVWVDVDDPYKIAYEPNGGLANFEEYHRMPTAAEAAKLFA